MPVSYSISRKSEGGLSEVHVRFYHGRECDLRARTRIFVPVSAWNAAEGRCNISRRYETPENIKARIAQNKLDELAQTIIDGYASAGGKVSREWLQKIIDHGTDERPLADLIDEYCRAKQLAPLTTYKLHSFEKHLRRFEQSKKTRIYAHTITCEQIYAFEQYLRTSGAIGRNALATRMKQLRALVYWAGRPYPNPFEQVALPSESYGDPYFLTADELQRVANCELTAAKAQQRDIFVFQCLVGCRISDLYALAYNNIKDGWLIYSPQKTQHNTGIVVEVPLSPAALSIIERYKGVSPDGRMFPFVSDVHYNRSIRLILQAAGIDRPVIVRDPKTGASSPHPIYEIASSHLARRTFTQLAYARTGDQRLVSSMTGHIPNSAAFSRYSKVTREMKLRALGIENAPSLPSEDARTKKSIS